MVTMEGCEVLELPTRAGQRLFSLKHFVRENWAFDTVNVVVDRVCIPQNVLIFHQTTQNLI